MCANSLSQWSTWLLSVDWWYNTTYHTTIQATLYEIVFDQPPPMYFPYLLGKSWVELVDNNLARREEMLKLLKFI